LNSDLWKPIQEHIGKLNSGSPRGVHHYTTLSGAIGILKSKQMWFSERSHLNDRSEVSYGLELAANILRERNRASDATHLETRAKDVFRDFRFFSASFSFEPDDLSHWTNYADDGQGVTLSFRADTFDKPKEHVGKFINDPQNVFVCPMSYDVACLESIIGHIIDRWSGSDIGELSDHLFMISSMFKHACWKSEKEYRFFVHHKRETILKSDCYKPRERNGQVVSYLEIPIQNWDRMNDFPIYRICLGPAAPKWLDAQLADFIFSSGVPTPREGISRSSIPYRSVRRI